jgi:TIR domain
MAGVASTAAESTELFFLSHSGADTQAAKDLDGLLRRGGVDVWLDVERLAPGDVWMDQLEAALLSAKHLIVYIGPSGVRNWVGREVRFAADRSTQDRSFRFFD